MSDFGQDVVLEFPVHVDVDLDIDAEGICSIVALLFEGDTDPKEIFFELEDVVESVTEYLATKSRYQQLYCLAHEFSRMSEFMREKASLIEDSSAVVKDLFSIDE